ncbi:MAG: glycosyltransferase family protein [Verrucomicrobiota bacterium]
MSRTIATIEARMTSSRLPGKVMLDVLGRPLLELLVERLQQSSALDGICLATTDRPTDDGLEELARRMGILCFRGSEDDVLMRVLGAAEFAQAEVIVEITADCPLMDPAVIDRVVDNYRNSKRDYVSNTLQRTYPDGLDVQVFATDVLRRVAALTDNPRDREHVSCYIYEHPDMFTLANVASGLPERFWNIRLTVDYRHDFERIRAIFEALYPGNPVFSLAEICGHLDRNPSLIVAQ